MKVDYKDQIRDILSAHNLTYTLTRMLGVVYIRIGDILSLSVMSVRPKEVGAVCCVDRVKGFIIKSEDRIINYDAHLKGVVSFCHAANGWAPCKYCSVPTLPEFNMLKIYRNRV